MNIFRLLSTAFLVSFAFPLLAQVEKVFVETYYVSDSNDATDTTGGLLPAGSTTYRVYIDLAPGSMLTKLYGDAQHALRISGSAPFFDNTADGQTFAKDFSKNRYEENTVALDSWLTLGETTRPGTRTYFGVPKEQDRDGSFIGGVNNDGGSAGITSGLLTNHDPAAGLPLTSADGMDTMTHVPSNWIEYGFLDQQSGNDSTIFGSLLAGTVFNSNNVLLANSGTMGINPDSNQVLVAQLTLRGTISFELNVETLEPYGSGYRTVKYVARLAPGESNSDTLKVSPFLTYPPVCGCTDPRYIEYDASYACNDESACHHLVVYGCMDTAACNFDPGANFHVQSLCCYPGLCQDRDLSVVCPQLVHKRETPVILEMYPNPAGKVIHLAVDGNSQETQIEVMDMLGAVIMKEDLGSLSLSAISIDASAWQPGIYLVRIQCGDKTESRKIVKE